MDQASGLVVKVLSLLKKGYVHIRANTLQEPIGKDLGLAESGP